MDLAMLPASTTLASVFDDQWTAIQNASLTNQIVDAVILLAIASVLRMAEQKTDLVFFKFLWYLAGGAACFVLYHALFA